MTYQRPIMREALFIHKKQTSHLLKRLLRTRYLTTLLCKLTMATFQSG